ncbi:MAG: twin-arginine translocase subunit TatC [Actinobacteria bacterium]|nr:twin-arginine translocase subunit TatC [Actinomycetota bacterium]MCG2800953.1 twin-arginine translocase subunit TatC [Cellulomonas sp.]
MSLREHLVELRSRVVRAAIGIVVGAVVGWLVSGRVMDLLFSPILRIAAERHQEIAPNFAGVASPFDMKIRVSIFLGILVSSPWWIYQLWAFVTPGLTRRERGYSIGFVAAAVPLFFGGAALAWWVIPNAVALLTLATPTGAVNLIDAQSYLTFVMQIMLAFGATFLLPLFMVGLTLAGLVSGRVWLRAWRWSVVIAFVFAAIATPTPDVVTMFAVAAPILLLYFVAVGICLLHDHRAGRRRSAAEDAAELGAL